MLKKISISILASVALLLNLIEESLPVGVIDSDVTLPIANTLSNEDEYADYTFRFNITTKLIQGGYLQVVFPSQFDSGLGIPLLPSCSVKCERNDRTVNFYFAFDLFPTVIYNVTINGIKNPATTGGTGNFVFRTKRGDNIIDESFIMGFLGIGGAIEELTSTTVAVDSSQGALAGQVSRYIFSFKSNTFLFPNIYAKFYLPKGAFDVSLNPSCSSFPINGVVVKGTFRCTYSKEFDAIEVRGFQQNIEIGGEVGISVSMRNPQYSFITGTFDIFIFKEGTTAAYTRRLAVNGIPIVPGIINQISILPVDNGYLVNRRKLIWMRLSFRLSNPLNEGSIIEIKIPDSMILRLENVLLNPSSFYVERGIDDISNDNPMRITSFTLTGSTYLRIENYKPQQQPNSMSVVMLLELPNSNGLSLPFEIRSYRSISKLNEIDRDVSTARIDVMDIPKPVQNPAPVFTPTVADGTSLLDISFSIEPSRNLPGFGQIKLYIDERLETMGVDINNCRVFLKNLNAMSSAQSCVKRDRDIYIQLKNQPYSLGVVQNFELNGVIKSPSLAGKYFIEVQTLSDTGEILESYTEELTFTASGLQSLVVLALPKWRQINAMHEITFTTPYRIPASSVQEKATDLVSFIQLEYSTDLPANIKTNLGMGISTDGTIPCRSIRGLTPINGYNINCTLLIGYPPRIRITNFQEVQKNENILIFMPNVENPTGRSTAPLGQWTLTIRLVTKENRLLKEISSSSVNFISLANTQSGVVVNIPSATGFYTYTSQTVSSDFNYFNQAQMGQDTTIAASSRILFKFPKYDLGYVPDEGHVTCRFDSQAFNCFQFQGLDWVYGSLASFQTIVIDPNSGPLSLLHVSNLRWPRYKPTTAITANIILEIYNPAMTYFRIFEYPTFDPVLANDFISVSLNVDKKRRDEVDVTYTFTFVPTNDIPAGGTVILTLPTNYNLIASFPPVRISYPEFQNLNSLVSVSHFYTSRIIQINNMAKHPREVPFRIVVEGMRNPSTGNVIPSVAAAVNEKFNIVTQLQGNTINERLNFITLTLSGPYSPGVILCNEISLFPTNVLVLSDYTFKFTPQTKLSPGAEIHIKFPSDYTNLPQSPSCLVEGGLQTFETCLRLADEIIIRLDTAYITDQIIFTVKAIQNPNILTTKSFSIYSFYDGSIVDTTSSVTASQRQLNLTPEASLVRMREFYFDPVNEAETANYVISFLPSNNILSSMSIYIKFPDTFDQRLGKKVDVFIRSGLTGDIKTKIQNRFLIITNFNQYTINPSNPVKIELVGVINPNKPLIGHSGFISVGVLRSTDNFYVDYLEQAALVETVSSPSWLTLHNITTSNVFSRVPASYSLNITVDSAVPKTSLQGKIYFDLPPQFEIGEGNLRCSNLTANLGQNIRCQLDKRTVVLSGHENTLTSNVAFKVDGIDSPIDEVKSDSMFVRTYDGFTREVIQRSFENLDPFKFDFKYPGPLIIVNEDKTIFIERGTQSKDMYLVCSEIMALNLTFFATTPGFQVLPQPLEMRIGQKKSKFRVSVPMSFPDGVYYIYWTTVGDLEQNIYTPVKKTKVIISKQQNVPIEVKEINDIPLGGRSLPVLISTEYAPDTGIELVVRLEQNYPSITLSSSTVPMQLGVNQNSFEILFTQSDVLSTATVQSGVVNLELIGLNAEIFRLSKTRLRFNVIQKDKASPEITDIQVTKVTQQTVEFLFSCSDISTAYIMLALKSTEQPEWQELKSLGPPEYETTRSVYQIIEVGAELQGFGRFENLEAETEYAIYVFLQDRGENRISAPGLVEFKTQDRHSSTLLSGH